MSWTVYRDAVGTALWINGADGKPLPWTEANARLIVKAPEMAALLLELAYPVYHAALGGGATRIFSEADLQKKPVYSSSRLKVRRYENNQDKRTGGTQNGLPHSPPFYLPVRP